MQTNPAVEQSKVPESV